MWVLILLFTIYLSIAAWHGKVPVATRSNRVIDEVGYPIILDALSNMAFGHFILGNFVPLQHMGGLMVFAIFFNIIRHAYYSG
ncbi:MAG: hypothetical protein CM1200mP10_03000 [Candidatus Neomarinimicrobiota bacterium]|nr:MAG: hypothetical protein CM1200mP10_03000 [Candidatus Neomarinimicrobiota bacterium]